MKQLQAGTRLKQRITLAVMLIVAVAMVISNAVGLYIYRNRELAAAHENLDELLNLMDAQSYITNAEELVEQFAAAAPEKRLTIISPEGTVLADSLNEELGDHSDRPEVEQALREGEGEATRRSETTGQTYLYVAKIFTDGHVGRAAMPIASLNAMMAPGVAGFVVAGIVALFLAFFLARRLAGRAAAPVEKAEVAVAQVDETLQNARSEFTANVTHELKTPLTSIKGFTDMMSSGLVKSPADQKRFLTMISVEVDRLINLINDILKVSELEALEGVSTDDKADLMAVTEEAAELLRPMAKAAGVTLSVTGSPVSAAIAAPRLKEVVLNLAENAIKYNQEGGTVRLRVTGDGQNAVLTVIDTGIGIPEESLGHVFERFYRVDKGRSRAQGGTGLGLAIVKHIVALYHGSVSVESTLGAGSTFTIRLPFAR